MRKKAVLFDHDGGVDDLISLMLLLQMKEIDLKGICITPADCYSQDAVLTTQRLLCLSGRPDIPIAVSDCRGQHAFPASWRAQPRVCTMLPDMLAVDVSQMPPVLTDATRLIAKLIDSQPELTILVTGPCTNVTNALHDAHNLHHVHQVIWMGGALNVRGNVLNYDHDGSAEWNAFWDPVATAGLINSDVPLTLVPLDMTNRMPIDRAFLNKLSQHRDKGFCALAGQFWAITSNSLPSYEFTYYMWDVLTTMLLAQLDSAGFDYLTLQVDTQYPSAGNIRIGVDSESRAVRVLTKIDQQEVLDRIFALLSMSIQNTE